MSRRSPWVVLLVLVPVYVLNFLDRQIPSILAERIKADLHVSDAEVGFLYGTAFAVFYALFGIPLGRLADTWNRTRLIALGLAFWSLMTALSGLAGSFGTLAAARVGVGMGEASAAPASYALLSDLFPPAQRATVLAVYQSGIHIGSGLGLAVGGLVVQRWDAAFGAAPPLGLHGWQVAFMVVGLPGLLLALAVRRLPEPARGAADGIVSPPEPHPFRAAARELGAVVPGVGLVTLARSGAGGRALAGNVALGLGVALAAVVLTRLLGTALQWICLGVGVYAAVSWAQTLGRRDPVAATLLFRTPVLRDAALGFACLAAGAYGIAFWTAPYFIRVLHAGEAEAGVWLGATHALAGLAGVTLGGLAADARRRRTPAGRLHVTMATAALAVPLAIAMLAARTTAMAFVLYVPLSFVNGLWAGPAVSTVQDLVLPRLRGTASAAYLLLVTLFGLALGPYAIGRLSVGLGDLRAAMLCGLAADVAAFVLLFRAARGFGAAETSLRLRARTAGETGI